MSEITEKERLDYFWKHFALIADQRVKTFNFYIIVVLATITGSIGALRVSTPRLTFLLIGAGHMFVVVVFWMIEARGKAILKIAKEALRDFERSPGFGNGYRPLSQDERKGTKGLWNLITYGNAFRLVFVVHFVFGMVIAFRPGLIVTGPVGRNPSALAWAQSSQGGEPEAEHDGIMGRGVR